MSKFDNKRLTELSRTSGCAAKIGPGTLAKVLGGLPKFEDERMLVGIETSDDAAVYQISDDLAMIQTLDFFTPVVDDPYTFGQIAATNALSDIYAMGGEPKVALNIVCFPNCLSVDILGKILEGGASKVKEAGAVLAGGHSVQDDEPKYGLSVTGFVHPDHVLKNYGSQVGDVLILTKPIGTGVIVTAIKGELASEEAMAEAIASMTCLNKTARDVAKNFDVHACTDVTGFGLMGHLSEMAEASHVTMDVNVHDVNFFTDALEYASMGLVPEGTYRNKQFRGDGVQMEGIEEVYTDLLFDPQSSGGLLFSVPADQAKDMVDALVAAGLPTKISVIGTVSEESDYLIRLHG